MPLLGGDVAIYYYAIRGLLWDAKQWFLYDGASTVKVNSSGCWDWLMWNREVKFVFGLVVGYFVGYIYSTLYRAYFFYLFKYLGLCM